MRVGVFFFGGVEMDAVGTDSPEPTARHYDQATVSRAQELLLDAAVRAEDLAYDSFWVSEHHFQYEGYEVVPNGMMLNAFVAGRTSRLRFGTMFNVVGQWHPLRLAEDFSMLHNLSGGRAILGVGRGTVPREILPLSMGRLSVGSPDNPAQAEADALNRAVTDEALDVLQLALGQDRFRHEGEHFCFPPPRIPDRGGYVETLTVIPRPRYPYEAWQAVTSPATLETVPVRGFGGVFWMQHDRRTVEAWQRFGELYAKHHGHDLAPGDKRMLVLNVRVADTHEQAMVAARPGHDELWRFLGPYGRGRGYRTPDGGPAPAGFRPTLEDSIEQRIWVVGDAAEVAEGIDWFCRQLQLRDLVVFVHFPGDSYADAEEQLERIAKDVLPLVG